MFLHEKLSDGYFTILAIKEVLSLSYVCDDEKQLFPVTPGINNFLARNTDIISHDDVSILKGHCFFASV